MSKQPLAASGCGGLNAIRVQPDQSTSAGCPIPVVAAARPAVGQPIPMLLQLLWLGAWAGLHNAHSMCHQRGRQGLHIEIQIGT